MASPLLVAYTTQSGSTAEVAQAVGSAIHELGLAVNVLRMSAVKSLDGYQGLIVGAPLYAGRFPRECHQFIAAHRAALAGMRPWLFVLGPTRNEAADFEGAHKQAEAELNRYPWLRVAELHIFGGRFDMDHLAFPFRLVRYLPASLLRRIPTGDIRDWNAIREWAQQIARQVKTAA